MLSNVGHLIKKTLKYLYKKRWGDVKLLIDFKLYSRPLNKKF